jgi:Xaa-Pro aminopeptidase
VREAEDIPGGERPMLSFETLTLAPIDRRLIDPGLLAPAELDWLNAYHRWVEGEIGGALDGADRDWLRAACAPIQAASHANGGSH